jgi:putative heme-binding domain-containing protein
MPSRDTGRIWRVVAEGAETQINTKWSMSELSSDELVSMLLHRNSWYVREARRILGERRDKSVYFRLLKMVRIDPEGPTALEALWALHVSGGLTDELTMEFLDHPYEHVRAWTVRLLGDRKQVSPQFNQRLVELARRDPSPTVRSQLACTCKRLPGRVALPVVEQLLGRAEDLNDRHIPLLLWWAIEDKAISDRERVMELAGTTEAWNRPITRAVVVERLARRYLAEGSPAGDAACARLLALAPTPAERERLIKAMELQMDGLRLERTPAPLAAVLEPLLHEGTPSPALVRLALRLGMEAAARRAAESASDPRQPAAERAEFIRTLGEMRRGDPATPWLVLLRDDQPVPVRVAALLALQRREDPEIARTVIDQYKSMPPALRDKARDVLVSRPAWSAALLAAVDRGTLPAADFSIDQVRRILLHDDPQLTARAETRWGRIRPATSRETQGRIMAVTEIVAKGKGDPDRGRPLVKTLCLNCHELFGEGEKIGPDLTAVDRRNLDVLLRNVLDPGAVIREGYQQYNVATKDGRILTGLLVDNSPEKVTLLDAKGVRTTLRTAEVETTARAETSLMPEGVVDPLSDQELRDLFAYLRSEPAKAAGTTTADPATPASKPKTAGTPVSPSPE